MTIIVGLNKGESTILASDSSASDDSGIEARNEAKVWRDGDWLVGSCPSFRLMQLLQYHIDITSLIGDPDEACIRDLVTKLVPVMKCVIEAEMPEVIDWTVILGGRGNLYQIQSDYAVNCVSKTIAIGSGSEYALGSLFDADSDTLLDAFTVASTAVRAACEHSMSCCLPYHLIGDFSDA